MEIALYITIVVLASVSAHPKIRALSDNAFRAVFLLFALLHSIIIRHAGFDQDIAVYAASMASISTDLYYLREPVIWFGQAYLFSILGDSLYTFVVFDIIFITIVLVALQNLRVPQYAIFALLAFFPFLLGIQNIYRQWAAACLMLLAVSNGNRHFLRSAVYFLLSAATHNVSAVFAPALAAILSSKYRIIMFTGSIAVTPAMFYFGRDSKSGIETGASLEYFYLVAVSFAATAIALGFRNSSEHRYLLPFSFSLIYVSALSAALLSSASSERVSMTCLILAYPFLAISLDRLVPKILQYAARLTLIIFGFAPLFLFSTRVFIL